MQFRIKTILLVIFSITFCSNALAEIENETAEKQTEKSKASQQEANGLAPEITDLSADDVSYALEKKIPDLKKPFIDTAPQDRGDGIPVGELGVDGGDKEAILKNNVVTDY